MYCFYSSDDTIIPKQDFIEIYNKGYFLGNARPVPRVAQNSVIAENEMERILKVGIKKPIDIYRIMAWKVGKIRHADSDAASEKQILAYICTKCNIIGRKPASFVRSTTLFAIYRNIVYTNGVTSFCVRKRNEVELRSNEVIC